MTPDIPSDPAPDGLVEVERVRDRYRIAVWHSETVGDFLWLSEGELGQLMARVREAAP